MTDKEETDTEEERETGKDKNADRENMTERKRQTGGKKKKPDEYTDKKKSECERERSLFSVLHDIGVRKSY